MQDSLTSSFRWGETFDTAPLSNQLDAVTFNGDGRTDRAFLQRVTRINALTRTGGHAGSPLHESHQHDKSSHQML